MKFEGIGFNESRLQEMDFQEFSDNVAHLLPFDKMKELYNLLHGNDQKSQGQVEGAEDTGDHIAID